MSQMGRTRGVGSFLMDVIRKLFQLTSDIGSYIALLLYILIGFIGGFRGDSATTNDTQKSSETTSQETVRMKPVHQK